MDFLDTLFTPRNPKAILVEGANIKPMGHFTDSRGIAKLNGAIYEQPYTCGCRNVLHLIVAESSDDSQSHKLPDWEFHIELCSLHRHRYDRPGTRYRYLLLRERCITLMIEYIKQENDMNMVQHFYDLMPQLRSLPLTAAVIDTFRGILGYDRWLGSGQPDTTESFLTDVMHDVQECIANHDKEWYSPRTSAYIPFYKPEE